MVTGREGVPAGRMAPLRFFDRRDAARQLAERLVAYRDQNPLILAVPRGAVPMARELADRLQGDLDVVLVRKIGAPGNPEYALGAVDETGWVYWGPYARQVASEAYLAEEKSRQLTLLRERRARYSPVHPPHDPSGRLVIVVDDGLATGASMIAALHAVRARKPARLVCAVPVSSPEAYEAVLPLADEVVCLAVPEGFRAVGQFYEKFDQVSDDEVVALLHDAPA